MNIPDLRADSPEITLEHCYVLVERLSTMFDLLEGTPGAFKNIQLVDPYIMQEYYQDTFETHAFARLFQTEMGKGVLVGAFARKLLEKSDEEAANEIDV